MARLLVVVVVVLLLLLVVAVTQGILMHVGEGLDRFIEGGHVVDLDEGLPSADEYDENGNRIKRKKKKKKKTTTKNTAYYVDRQTPRGQHQTTAVVGSGVYEAPRELTAAEKVLFDATRAESQRTAQIFDAVRARNGSRFSPGRRRRSFGVFRRADGHLCVVVVCAWFVHVFVCMLV